MAQLVLQLLRADSLWHYIKLYGVSFLLFGVLLTLLYNRYASPLRKFPGPLLASSTRLWQVWTAWTGKAEEHYIAVHRQYGPIVRLGPNEISMASPLAALDIFNPGKGFYKSDFYTIFLPPNVKDLFTEIREPVHAVMKRFAVPPYSLASVQQHTEDIEALLGKFQSKMDDFALHDKSAVDLGSWLHYLAFDVLGQFAFAHPFGFLDAGTDMDGFCKTIRRSGWESGIVGQVPFVEKLTRSNPIWKYVPFLPENAVSLLPRTAELMLKRHLEEDDDAAGTGPKCLLKAHLESHNEYPDKFSIQDVISLSTGAVAAGSDSTASTMQSFVWHVLSNSKIHDKLVTEILSSPLSEMVQYKEAQALEYFQACLKETMRLQPALGANITRIAPAGGTEINGIWLPGGTQVALNAWVLHRDKDIFGADVDLFNPERWLSKDENRVKMMERCMFQFGGGSHLCIGRHLALFEMNKLLPQLFRRYEMTLVSQKPLDHITGLFYLQSGLYVYLRRRKEVHL
ncbi:uncharacterized protein Z519_02846 [Cladophialophora bantiana CBS 173.52]|uniref:Cytochrome P450 oxidoreductase n=1 Tax=Cladophialophora bantiana (strain ATCC 10958 / CBS 173.52 / CDC B-1940 / NIH 8579) TaxID=1442370 RepID=A0A0D2GB13_CLAB1|nr:uncharacterized protein Z519_02846 [Cladophialophora bantiana CBS 173.52]KIW95782.1 hypothetical protein Z519_02846 [Cladophialophora bantiana CBS 173.52]